MTALEARVHASGLLAGPVLVLLSGGRDSVCLLDLAVRLAPRPVAALHVDYGLRPTAAGDAALCAELCERLGVPLHVHRPAGPSAGNLQAWAREERYAAARRLVVPGQRIATGHTATDQVETVLYRLAASPGRRALLGMPAAGADLVRPLLTSTREETAAHARARGLAWREDPTNAEPAYARNRVRHGLVPALRAIHPAAERNVLATLATLRDEAAVLDAAVAAAADPPELARLAALPPALGSLAVQHLADRATAPRPAPQVGPRAREILALSPRGTASLDVGGGLRAVAEYGRLRFDAGAGAPAAPPEPTLLPVPGHAAFGATRLTAAPTADAPGPGVLDADALAPPLTVRSRRPGDRMRPLGAPGSRRLQDLLTDRRIPREARDALPVVLSGGEIAWVPGVATGTAFAVTPATRARVRLAWLR